MNYTKDYVTGLFPEALKLKHEGGTKYPCLAISIFDHWLNEEEAHIIDNCSAAERKERDEKLTSHWQKLFKLTAIFELDNEGALDLVSEECAFIERSKPTPNKTADKFQFVILPEYKAIYAENWDDTNLLWYQNRKLINPIIRSAMESGLHVLENST